MRNYISTVFRRALAHADDGGGGTFDTVVYAAGGDVEDSEARFNIAKRNLESGFPGWTFTYENNPAVRCYFLIDKDNIVTFANFLSSYFYPVAIEVQGPPELNFFRPDLDPVDDPIAPRKGWTDYFGVRRRETPSDKGDPAYDLVKIEEDR
jgi:hypothetical protein